VSTEEPLALLEFDHDRSAVFEPHHTTIGKAPIPPRLVLCFYSEIIDALPPDAERVGELVAAHGRHPIWRLERHGQEIAVLHPGVGAPLAAAFLEEAIALGARKVVACGGCGAISPDVGAGDIVIPNAAVRDEGTSFHYLPAARQVEADLAAVAVAAAVLDERGVAYQVGKVWTTDGLFRETRAKVERRRAEGCLVVEMETAAFFAVARFRGIQFTQLLYGGDDLTGEAWDEREWTVSPSRRLTFELALEVASRL
jgi:uridine phosphorylase